MIRSLRGAFPFVTVELPPILVKLDGVKPEQMEVSCLDLREGAGVMTPP